jgi:Tfp pilus assembly protein PilN
VAPSEDLLHRLSRVSPGRAFLATLVVMLLGLFLPGIVGAAVLCLLAAALITLTVATWPIQPARTRAVRIILLAVLVLLVLSKIV